MPTQGIKTFFASVAALVLGIAASLMALASLMKQEIPRLLQKQAPTPILTEQNRALSQDESSTMSASFIREFEMIVASESGEKK